MNSKVKGSFINLVHDVKIKAGGTHEKKWSLIASMEVLIENLQ
jgi:hypothetical protein